MPKQQSHENYFLPILLAVVLHVLLFVYIFYSLKLPTQLTYTTAKLSQQPKVPIQAVSVDQQEVEKAMAKIQQQQLAIVKAHQQEQQQLNNKRNELKQQQTRTAKALAALKAQQQAQQNTIKDLEHQRMLLARQQAVQELQDKLQQAQRQQQIAFDQKLAKIVDRYKQLIVNSIRPNWLVSKQDMDLSTDLLINLAPSGVVLNVSVAKSSGSSAFDRSAITAVYKSSPLPVPKNGSAFAPFKQFKLTLQPEQILPGSQ